MTYILTDDTFYFMDGITTQEEVITIPPGTEPITGDDYEIEYLTYSVLINDAVYNEQTMRFTMGQGTFGEEELLHIDAKFSGSDGWIEDVAVINLFTEEGTRNDTYVTKLQWGKVYFTPGCTGYRVRTSNTHYRTRLEVMPYCKLKNSALVMERITDLNLNKERAWLTNTGSFTLSDYQGQVYYAKDIIGRDYISGYKKEVTIEKENTGIRNLESRQAAQINWRVKLFEDYLTNDGLSYIPQDSGTFYDLLPIGMEAISDTVSIQNEKGVYLSRADYDYVMIPNYRSTGRTMMVVRIKEPFNYAILTYSTLYSWESMVDYGTLVLNSVAYETGNDALTDGFPDNGGQLIEADLMEQLDKETDGDLFVYAEWMVPVDVTMSASLGLTKRVKSPEDELYTAETTVHQNGEYSYRLRYAADSESSAKDVILYDILEAYTAENVAGSFRGALQSVDISQAQQQGAAPVVYLSVYDDFDMTTPPDLTALREGEPVWKPLAAFGEISEARAVAIDISKNEDGEDFVLNPGRSIAVTLNMKAPASDEGGSAAPTAYNQAYLSNTILYEDGTSEPYYIHHGYTSVHYRIASDVSLLKTDKTDPNISVKGVEFSLVGTSDYGTVCNETLTTDKEGRLTFRNIEKGTYTLTETAGNDDYRIAQSTFRVQVDSQGRILFDGVLQSPEESYVIQDEPRAHADVTFYKRSLSAGARLISGAVFELSGRSAYGSDILLYGESKGGKVTFNNIEKGTYRLREVKPAEGYLMNETFYQVKVDETGSMTFAIDTTEGSGDADTLSEDADGGFTIYNEPLHSFTLVKEGYTFGIPIEGAVFELKGTSDRGTAVEIRAPTAPNGTLSFRGLESGIYTLRELSAPEGYLPDDAVRAVTIDKFDNVTIEGVEQDENGFFPIKNKENTTITIIKKWIDPDDSGRYEENEQEPQPQYSPGNSGGRSLSRAPQAAPLRSGDEDGRTPVIPGINISSQIPGTYAFFDGVSRQSILSRLTAVNNIRSFAPFSGTDDEARDLLGDAVTIDDNTTDYHIYAWYDSATGAVTWWSDARRVFMTDDSHYLWYGLNSCTSLDISGIDTSRVTDMSEMFSGDTSLTALDLSGLETGRCTNMSGMFSGCTALYDLDIANFNTANVTTMESMFAGCQSLTAVDTSHFDAGRVTSMENMFNGCSTLREIDLLSLSAPLNTTMEKMFYGCASLKTADLRGMETSNVTSLESAFYQCASLEKVYFSGLDFSSLTTMKTAFREASSLQEVYFDHVYATCLASFYTTFYQCSALKKVDFTDASISGITDMTGMFYENGSLQELDLRGLDTSKVTTFNNLFRKCTSLTKIDLSEFSTDSATNMRMMFYYCSSLRSIDVSSFNTRNATDMYAIFATCLLLEELDLTNFDTSNVTNMSYMFYHCKAIKSINVSSFDTSKATTMAYMFRYCEQLEELDLSNFDLYNVTTTDHMFQWSTALKTLDLSSFYTPHATRMEYMFNNCHGLKTLITPNFDTSKVTDMSGMIADCHVLKNMDLSCFDVRNVTSLNGFLYQAFELEAADLSNFYTPNMTNCANMFYKDSKLRTIDLTGMDLIKTSTTQAMFYNNSSLTTIYVSNVWDASRVGTHTYMFTGCTSIEGGAGTTYNSSYTNRTYARIDSTDTPGYLTWRAESYSTDPPPEPEERMTNDACFGSEGETTSVLSRICDLAQIKAFVRFTGDPERVQDLIDAGSAVRIDDGTALNPPIYGWLEEDGTLQYYTTARHISLTDSSRCLWRGLTNCESIDTTDISTTGMTTMSRMFEGDASLASIDLSGFVTSTVTDMSYLFSGCTSLTSFNINSFDGSVLRNMSHMFSSCRSLPTIHIPIATNAAEDMSYLYSGCSSAKTITWKKSPAVTDLSHAFEGCAALTTLTITTADTSHVTDMSFMFAGCRSLESVNSRVFTTAAATNLKGMFKDCASMIAFHVNGFELSSADDLSEMFSGCVSMTVLDLTMLDTSNVTKMTGMFDGCTAVKTIYADEAWNTDSVNSSENMFRGCQVLTGGYGTQVDADLVDKTLARIDTETRAGYLTNKGARHDTVTYTTESDNCTVEIADDDTWIFTFTGLDPTVPFYVWEDDYEGYDPSNTLDRYLSVINGEAVVTNKKKDYDPPE